jgi:HAD superfamily hydrolase (TIGR01490 family)
MADKRRVAVFDVDGTIFRSSMLIEMVDELIAEGVFPREARHLFEKQKEQWLDREGDYEAYIQAVLKAYYRYLKGVHYSRFLQAAENIVDAHWKRTYRYTRDLLAQLKEKDYYLLAVSHSPKTILDQFCPRFGFDKAYGTIYETGPNECFTGEVIDAHLIFNKAAILKRAVEKENLTLAYSVGVGDTESDIPFLDMVAKPICFNPNKRLYTYAKRQGWKVVVERKDVVYQL